jgi:acyl-CoA:acyl-CoA alkyltransferase
MTSYSFSTVNIEGFGVNLPTIELSSSEIEDRIAPLYERLRIPFGTLERLSGVQKRRVWGREMAPSTAGAEAVKAALEDAKVSISDVEALISCSVCRDLFEPSTACIMHEKLGLQTSALAFDITNACIGFSNGLMVMANMIESGAINCGVVVSGENPAIIIDSNFSLIKRNIETFSREDLLKVLPTFTLGGGAVAWVLKKASKSKKSHRYLGGVALVASEHAGLCSGNGDFCVMIDEEGREPVMHTESSLLIASAAKLGGETWIECSKMLGWRASEIDHVVCHQVGKQVNESFYNELGLPFEKDFAAYEQLGNSVSAALPIAVTLAASERPFKEKDKIVLTAFGSGLNSVFSGIEW